MNVSYCFSNTYNGFSPVIDWTIRTYEEPKLGFLSCFPRGYESLYACEPSPTLNRLIFCRTYEQCRYFSIQYIFTSITPMKKRRQHKKYQNNLYSTHYMYLYNCLLLSQYYLSNRVLSVNEYCNVNSNDLYSKMMNQLLYIHIFYHLLTRWSVYMNHIILTRTKYHSYHSLMRSTWSVIQKKETSLNKINKNLDFI